MATETDTPTPTTTAAPEPRMSFPVRTMRALFDTLEQQLSGAVPLAAHAIFFDGHGTRTTTSTWTEVADALDPLEDVDYLDLLVVWTSDAVVTARLENHGTDRWLSVTTVPLGPAVAALSKAATAIGALHVSSYDTRGVGRYHPDRLGQWSAYCEEDSEDWPCTTARLLNPALSDEPA